MSINIRFAPDLVLRDFSEHLSGNKKDEECVPKSMKSGQVYSFLKLGQRVYWLDGEQPLLKKSVDGKISPPIASVVVLEYTHFKEREQIWTKGKYRIVKVLKNGEIYFNGCDPIKNSKESYEKL